MSDTPADVKGTAAGAKDAAADKAKEAKPPARPVSEIRADIEKERAELTRSFDTLRADLDEAVDAGRQRAADTGRKAKIVGPAVAGVVTTLVVARMLYKRRVRKRE